MEGNEKVKQIVAQIGMFNMAEQLPLFRSKE